MDQIDSIEALAQVIQLAVAPVFLLAGIAGLLGVLSTRLSRIIDRARVIERRIPRAKREEQRQLLHTETTSLWRRTHLIQWAIRSCVMGALMICLVISLLIAALFVVAMLLIITGLIFFLREVAFSTKQTRQGIEVALDEASQEQPNAGI
jgi:uncharacterized membrane protein YGL010W